MDVTKTFMHSPKLGFSFNSNPWMLRQGNNHLADFPSTNIYALLGQFKSKENEARDNDDNEKATAYANMTSMIETAVLDTLKLFPRKGEEFKSVIEIDDSVLIPIWLLKGLLGDWILPYAIHSYIPGFRHYNDGFSLNFIDFKCELLSLTMYLRTISKIKRDVRIWALPDDEIFDAQVQEVIEQTGDINSIFNVFTDENGNSINLRNFEALFSQIDSTVPIDPATELPMIVVENKENILEKFFGNLGYSGYNDLRRIATELFKDKVETDWETILSTLWDICRTLGKPIMTHYNLIMNGFLYRIDMPYSK